MSPKQKSQTASIFIATLLAGTIAGFFLTYGFTIMRGLATTDDQTFVAAFQGLERTFGDLDYGVNWPVLFGFFGLPIVIAVAIAVNRQGPEVRWLVAALALSIATIVFTQVFNVPANETLKAAGDPATIDVAQVRATFNEGSWRFWNHARSATSLGAFVCLTWSLVRRAEPTLSSERVGARQ